MIKVALKKKSDNELELDKFRVTIAFGLLSFQVALIVFVLSHPEISSLEIIFGGLVRGLIGFSCFTLFLFILCTAAFYRSKKKGVLDFLHIDKSKKDTLFDDAIEWSFVSSSIVITGYAIHYVFGIIDVKKCGQELWSLGVCTSGIISASIFAFLLARAFYKSIATSKK